VLLQSAGLCEPEPGLLTFPSWRPDRQLDHILVSPSIMVERVEVLDHIYSDHLPIAMEVRLPEEFKLQVPVISSQVGSFDRWSLTSGV
jgi:hypothetical protein